MKQLLLPFIVALLSCNIENESHSSKNKFSDPVLRQIYSFENERNADSLLTFLSSENETYRENAALGLASVQDSSSISDLGYALTNDNSPAVRKAAAFALGQTRNEVALDHLRFALEKEEVAVVKKEILIAIGKCNKEEDVFQNFQFEDSLMTEGLIWGIYFSGLNGFSSDSTLATAAKYLNQKYSHETRLAASHYFSRVRDVDLTPYQGDIADAAKLDNSVFVRMAAASALSKCTEDFAVSTLQDIVTRDEDYRVIINALKAIGNFDENEIAKEFIAENVENQDVNVSITAAEVLSSKWKDPAILKSFADKTSNWRVRTTLLTELSKIDSTGNMRSLILDAISSSRSTYEKSYLLRTLSQWPSEFENIRSSFFSSEDPLIKSTAFGTMANIARSNSEFDAMELVKLGLETDNLSIIRSASRLVRNEDLIPRDALKFDDYFAQLKPSGNPQKEKIIQSVIDYVSGMEVEANANFAPMNWELIQSMGVDKKITLLTTKGDIVIQLDVESSPQSVSNFVSIARSGYYDNNYIHRVAPNFVIQGGSNFGTGGGGAGHIIKSEFRAVGYKEGFVGMASAGKDTEGSQWFITHSPTPHLDGRYTIFGRVISGMDVVHAIEVGDSIIDITE